jgi:hypothetical protein
MRSEKEIRRQLDNLLRRLNEAEVAIAEADPGQPPGALAPHALAAIGTAAIALKWAVGDADTSTLEQVVSEALAIARQG